MVINLISQNINGVPVVSGMANLTSTSEKEVIAVLLLPPGSRPEKRSGFQKKLYEKGITTHIIVNRGTETRHEEPYSFVGMQEDLLKVLRLVRNNHPDARVVLSTTCLATVAVGGIIDTILNDNLLDGMVIGIPVTSLEHLQNVHNCSTEEIQSTYGKEWDLVIDYNQPRTEIGLMNPIEKVCNKKDMPYQPFIYYNTHSPYLDPGTRKIIFESVKDGHILSKVFEEKMVGGLNHTINRRDIPILRNLTIEYIKGTLQKN